MTQRLSLFNSPLLLGFEHFERTFDRIAKQAGDSYPPYNIERLAEDRLRITIAVAGFTAADLSVETADNQLVVRGRAAEDKERVFLHRGIAARAFQRSFVLAEGIEIDGAGLENGLLSIDLRRPPAEAKVRRIAIDDRNGAQGGASPSIGISESSNQSVRA